RTPSSWPSSRCGSLENRRAASLPVSATESSMRDHALSGVGREVHVVHGRVKYTRAVASNGSAQDTPGARVAAGQRSPRSEWRNAWAKRRAEGADIRAWRYRNEK